MASKYLLLSHNILRMYVCKQLSSTVIIETLELLSINNRESYGC